jgi:hypothetical protein
MRFPEENHGLDLPETREIFKKDRADLEHWISNNSHYQDTTSDEEIQQRASLLVKPNEADASGSSKQSKTKAISYIDSEDGKSEEEASDDDSTPNVQGVENFLIGGEAFRALSTRLTLLVLPPKLRRTVLTFPWNTLSFSEVAKLTFSDRLKYFCEFHSGISWNWWPLKPLIPPLQGQIRMQWHCVRIDRPFLNDQLSNLV